MNNKQLSHEFANGRTDGKGSNMFIDGDTIFSYGRHFPIATRYTIKEVRKTKAGNIVNERVFTLFTSHGYSITTTKHKSHVRGALHGTVLTVPKVQNAQNYHIENMKYLTDQINTLREKSIRATKNASNYMADANTAGIEFIIYAQMFGIKLKGPDRKLGLKIMAGEVFTPEEAEKLRASIKERTAKEKIKERERMDKLNARLRLWIDGEEVQDSFRGLPVMLRIKNNEVQTSHGARVDIKDAVKLWDAHIARTLAPGYKVNEYYTVSSVGELALVIGCHEIPMAEVDRVGSLIEGIRNTSKG